MVDTGSVPGLGTRESILLALDVGVPGAAYRTLLGASVLPLARALFGAEPPAVRLSLLLLFLLVSLRVGTAVARKVIPASPMLKEAWSVRRRTAKYFDSYQWRKLFWFGLGLALYAMASASVAPHAALVTAFCLAAGAAGMFRWRMVAASPKYAKPAARRIK
jgi:hypothetical protein